MNNLTRSIEESIRSRQLGKARKLIHELTNSKDRPPEIRLAASEYLRRIGDYVPAVRVLRSESLPDEPRLQLQLARLLNLLGGSAYALRIVSRISPSVAQQMPAQIAGIFGSNYRSAEALPYFAEAESASEANATYAQKLQLISAADCYFGIGEKEKARHLVEKIIQWSDEPLLLAIAHQALGSYFLQDHLIAQSEKHLEESLRHFSPDDRTLDRGYLAKWMGARSCLKKNFIEARRELGSAWKILFRPGLKPEIWQEVRFWIGLCDFFEKDSFPEEWSRLVAYPGSSDRRFLHWIERYAPIPRWLNFGSGKTLIDLESNVKIENHEKKPVAHFGLRTPDRLLGALLIAGKFGIPQYRLYEALWPDEPFSFSQHQKRLEQVVFLARRDLSTVQWPNTTSRSGPEQVSAADGPLTPNPPVGSF